MTADTVPSTEDTEIRSGLCPHEAHCAVRPLRMDSFARGTCLKHEKYLLVTMLITTVIVACTR